MKKILVILSVLLILFSLSIPCFAASYISLNSIRVYNISSPYMEWIDLKANNGPIITWTADGISHSWTIQESPVTVSLSAGTWFITSADLLNYRDPTNSSVVFQTDTSFCIVVGQSYKQTFNVTDNISYVSFYYISDNNSLSGNVDYENGFTAGYDSQQSFIDDLLTQVTELNNTISNLTDSTDSKITALKRQVQQYKIAAANAYEQGARDNTGEKTLTNAIKLGFNGVGRSLTALLSITFIGIPLYVFAIIPVVIGLTVWTVQKIRG